MHAYTYQKKRQRNNNSLIQYSLGDESSNIIIYIYIYTSGKNFIKITSVGMCAAKSNETSRNGNVGEFRHMTIYILFFKTLLVD